MGCGTASREAQKGVLKEYTGESSLENVKEPFVAVMGESYLSKELMENVLSSNKYGYLQGILVANTSVTSQSNNYYSPQSRSPNGKRTPSQQQNYGNSAYGWNSYGDALVQVDFKGIPMAYVLDRSVSMELLQHSRSDKDVVAEFNYYMGNHLEMNSPTCLAWRDAKDNEWRPKCLPLGGTSVWSHVGVNSQQNNAAKPVLILAASMDGSSLFHDATPAFNQAVSNILAVIGATQLLKGIDTSQWSYDIVVSLFQGEQFGFVGSRRFLKDVLNFQCKSEPVLARSHNSTLTDFACLYPLRHSLEFSKLSGRIAGLLAVDQVGLLANNQNLYLHADGNSDMSNVLANLLQTLAANGYTVSEVEPQADDDHFDGGDVTVPPTPLTSLLSLTNGQVGGAVLTGYADKFVGRYGSHRDSAALNLDAIATAATTLARTVVAVANNAANDQDTAVQTALQLIPNSLNPTDLEELGTCLTQDGAICDLINRHARFEAATESFYTGLSISTGITSLKNYYTSVYYQGHGQPFVVMNSHVYGAYSGKENNDAYGKSKGDAFAIQPNRLELALRGIIQDNLGRPASASFKSCHSTSDCQSKVDYCPGLAVCTASKECVCRQAHFHPAVDEALEAAPNNGTGMFEVLSDGSESALYTEPYWDAAVGVKVYRQGSGHEWVVLVVGLLILGVSVVTTLGMKQKLVKEKLF
jgi:nicastrin